MLLQEAEMELALQQPPVLAEVAVETLGLPPFVFGFPLAAAGWPVSPSALALV